MQRPVEYDGLIRSGYFHEVNSTEGYKEQYLKVAQGYLADAEVASTTASQYLLAYEGFYQVVQSVLEHYSVRASDRQGHRTVAIQRVSADLKMSPGEIKLITDCHARRNESTYRAPLPPISEQEAKAMLQISKKAYEQAKSLI